MIISYRSDYLPILIDWRMIELLFPIIRRLHPKILLHKVNSGQAPFTNEDIMKTGNPAMINIVRKILMCVRSLRTHIRRFRTDIRKLLTENMKMKNQQRGFKRWLLRKKCREPFTLHFLSVNCLVSVLYMGEGWFRPFTTLHCPSPDWSPAFVGCRLIVSR